MALTASTSIEAAEEEPRTMGQRNFQVESFEAVALEGSFCVVVNVGGESSVRAEGDSSAVENLDVHVEDGTLKIRSCKRPRGFRGLVRRATVYVATPELNRARVSGSGNMRVDRVDSSDFRAAVSGSGPLEIGELQARQAELSVAGSGSVSVGMLDAQQTELAAAGSGGFSIARLQTDELHVSVAGSGGVQAAGASENARLRIAGSGSARLDQLQTRRASVRTAGSGNLSLFATETVEGSICGSGNITVHGGASCAISRSGSGTLHCRP